MIQHGQIAGLIFGMTAGDCLGSPYIFMRSKNLFEQAAKICWEIAPSAGISHMMFASLGCISRCGLDHEKISRAYQNWVRLGLHELDFISVQCFGTPKTLSHAELLHNAQTAEHGALCGNQLLIRQIPITLACLRSPLPVLCEHIEADALITHVDEETIQCAKLYAQCMHCVLNKKTRTEIWDMLFEQAKTPAIYKLLLNSYYEKPVCDAHDYSHAKIALSLSLHHFWHNTPFVSALRSTILSGGATDTNAAAVGALLGASQGIKAIPSPWRACLRETENSEPLRLALLKAEKLTALRPYAINRPSRRSIPTNTRYNTNKSRPLTPPLHTQNT
ncbi:MAG: ADP-ribosylglycohydrolase family protein [Proteobacteria bacterium]|nr:ADP-ribosylglycohydrolase family protein [Pseudomonadota bacterium]